MFRRYCCYHRNSGQSLCVKTSLDRLKKQYPSPLEFSRDRPRRLPIFWSCYLQLIQKGARFGFPHRGGMGGKESRCRIPGKRFLCWQVNVFYNPSNSGFLLDSNIQRPLTRAYYLDSDTFKFGRSSLETLRVLCHTLPWPTLRVFLLTGSSGWDPQDMPTVYPLPCWAHLK